MNKDTVIKTFRQSRTVLSLNFMVLCFLGGAQVREAKAYGLGTGEYIILVLTNHYYILYFLCPVLFLVISGYIRGVSDSEIVRYRNYAQMIWVKTLAFTTWLAVYFLAVILILLLIGGAALGLSKSVDQYALTDSDNMRVCMLYMKNFHYPQLAILCIAGYFLFGFTCLVAVTERVHIKYGFTATWKMLLVVYVLMFVGFKTDLKTKLPLLFFSNYIILHHALFMNGPSVLALLLIVGACAVWFACGGEYVLKKQMTRSMHQFGLRELIITRKEWVLSMTVPAGIFAMEGMISGATELSDVPFRIFYGSSASEPSFINWLTLTILSLAPLFIAGASDSRLMENEMLPLIVRHRNRLELEFRICSVHLHYLAEYAAIIWAVGNILLLFGMMEGASRMDRFDFVLWNAYMLLWLLKMTGAYLLFQLLSRRIQPATVLIADLVLKFVLYFLPDFDLLWINPGITNLIHENAGRLAFTCLAYAAFMASLIFAIQKKKVDYERNRNQKPL